MLNVIMIRKCKGRYPGSQPDLGLQPLVDGMKTRVDYGGLALEVTLYVIQLGGRISHSISPIRRIRTSL
ncbi:uncharacterized protein L3040_009523 [Drepanopeziza brunnea f. sp. 'multigermtubi']|uniref:uncharacterized protein n=1 Tax=Drepanopeziza brunnea f. sp. 'multigermtubi' TaxID=698441 RepID=UPI0023A2AFFF|nr:hypothetical protein L3040_009523 [Drepanopeziza brunnea f. sp. 'multigermtubi']